MRLGKKIYLKIELITFILKFPKPSKMALISKTPKFDLQITGNSCMYFGASILFLVKWQICEKFFFFLILSFLLFMQNKNLGKIAHIFLHNLAPNVHWRVTEHTSTPTTILSSNYTS